MKIFHCTRILASIDLLHRLIGFSNRYLTSCSLAKFEQPQDIQCSIGPTSIKHVQQIWMNGSQ